jgi:hypothetical protein
MVQELSKTIVTYYAEELTSKLSTWPDKSLRDYMNSTSHMNQFVMFFTDQGKLLTTIG